MRTLILLAFFVVFLGQLTPRFEIIKSIYQIDLIASLQTQFALLSIVLSLLLGFWNRTVMVIFLLVSGLLIAANFNAYLNSTLFISKTEELVNQREGDAIKVLQYTFDDSLDLALAPIYQEITQHNAGLIILFNVNELHINQLKTLSEGRFNYGIRKKESLPSNIAIISKYPISKKQKTSFLDERGDLVSLGIVFNKQTLDVFAMHPPRPTTEVNWRRRNLMLNTLEARLNNSDTTSPYSLVVTELYATVWSKYFPNLTNLRSCAYKMGLYGTWYAKRWLKSLGGLGAINTSHCFVSYRLKTNNLETHQVAHSDNNIVTYSVSIPTT